MVALDHVCIASIEWEFLWQGPQEVMASLARAGDRVLYVENTGIRAPHVTAADLGRIVQRARSWSARPAGALAEGEPRVTIMSPLVLPFPWSAAARRANRILLADRLPAKAVAVGMERPVVWSFLPSPLALDVMRAFRGRRALAVYYCMQDFEKVSDRPAALVRAEEELLGEVDVVFSGSRFLHERLARLHPHVVQAPVTVGERFFEPPAESAPADIGLIPSPRVGYLGGIHRHFDVGLVASVARRMPDVQFVLVGLVQGVDIAPLRLRNVHLLGSRPHADLPAYVDAFDVGLIPYHRTPFTATVWPTKLHEYLARGKPVVSTSLPEVVAMAYPVESVRVADDPSATEVAIRKALASGPDDRRRQAAALHRSSRVMGEVRGVVARAVEPSGDRLSSDR